VACDLVHTLGRVAEGCNRPGYGHDGATTTAELAGGTPDGPGPVQIEPLRADDVAAAVELVARVQRVDPGDRGEQFASDITDHSRQMFVAKANGHVVAYGRVGELAAGEAAPGTPAGCYLSGVLVDPAWRRSAPPCSRSGTASAGSRYSRPTTPSPDTPTSSTSDSSTSSNPADDTLSRRPSFKREGGLA
jgi:hypothetical protein